MAGEDFDAILKPFGGMDSMTRQRQDRLDFRLAPFTNLSWVSQPAKEVWQPRIQGITEARLETTIRTALTRADRIRLVQIPPYQYLKLARRMRDGGREAADLSTALPSAADSLSWVFNPRPNMLFVALGAKDLVEDFQSTWGVGFSDDRIGALGWPDCCLDFLKVLRTGRWIDPTWPSALRGQEEQRAKGDSLEVDFLPGSNLLLKRADVRPVDHLPCSPRCVRSQRNFELEKEQGISAGFEQEYRWLSEMLQFPAEWTALNGIAELRTPLFRISSETDARAQKRTLRRLGDHLPAEAPPGILFPFVSERHRFSESDGFRRGLESPLSTEAGEKAAQDSLVLIGPECAGKTTQARLLSKALGLPCFHLDEECWSYYREEARFAKAYAALLKQWNQTGLEAHLDTLRRECLTRLQTDLGGDFGIYWEDRRLHALKRFIADHRVPCVLDLGAGHAAFGSPTHRKRAARVLQGHRRIFLLLPGKEMTSAEAAIEKRAAERVAGGSVRSDIEALVDLPVSKIQVDTSSTPDETRDWILNLLEPGG